MKKTKDKTKILGFIWFFILLGLTLCLAGIIFAQYRPVFQENDQRESWKKLRQKLIVQVPETKSWEKYSNNWYGFEVKYPNNFKQIKKESGNFKSSWEYKYSFLKDTSEKSNEYLGFQIIIYNLEKIKEFSNTEEFPQKKEAFSKTKEYFCLTVEDGLNEIDDFEVEEVYVSEKNYCYKQAFFFMIIKDEYVYNIIPLTEVKSIAKDKSEIIKNFPEFLGFVSSFTLTEIRRPKPKPKITAPYPVSYKVENGHLVCAKKHDKPRKSKKDKGKHLDMECCLDPDEYPNPHCYYDPEKYGKYLK